MSAHTPTPWRQSDEVHDCGTYWEHSIIGQGGGTVAVVTSKGVHGPDRKAEMYANAELIVRAGNSHAALVQIAKWVASFDEDCTGDGTRTCVCHGCEGARARAALAQARGEA